MLDSEIAMESENEGEMKVRQCVERGIERKKEKQRENEIVKKRNSEERSRQVSGEKKLARANKFAGWLF